MKGIFELHWGHELSVFRNENYSFDSVFNGFIKALEQRTGKWKKYSIKNSNWILEMYEKSLKLHSWQLSEEKTFHWEDIPYITHPVGVWLRAMINWESARNVIAWLFHDADEETSYKNLSRIDKISYCKSAIVVRIVELLTNIDSNWKIPDDIYQDNINKLSMSLRLKAYDMNDNLDSFLRMIIKNENVDLNRILNYVNIARRSVVPKLIEKARDERCNKIFFWICRTIINIETQLKSKII